MKRAALLERGETVGVVAPGFAVKPRLLRQGLAALHGMGFSTRVGEHALAREGYLAGDDAARLTDFETMIRDPEVRAIWFARGGYGTARLLDRIPWRAMKRRAPLLIGYSDLTALFAAAVGRSEVTCLYGPVVTELGDPASYHASSLRTLLAGRSLNLPLRRSQVLAEGRASGRLLGGNLSTLAHLCGTRFFPDLRGSILFLEETGEQVYRVDRMLNQLRQAGALSEVAGLVLGSFNVPRRRRFPPDRELVDVLSECLAPLEVPVAYDLPAGHIPAKRTLPLGWKATLDTSRGRLRFEP